MLKVSGVTLIQTSWWRTNAPRISTACLAKVLRACVSAQ
jgi:hypothetical protein